MNADAGGVEAEILGPWEYMEGSSDVESDSSNDTSPDDGEAMVQRRRRLAQMMELAIKRDLEAGGGYVAFVKNTENLISRS